MKFQVITFEYFDRCLALYGRNVIELEHYKIFNKLGFRMHANHVIACYEYRPAILSLFLRTKPKKVREIRIPIPFVKDDITVGLVLMRG